ncbi:MAG: isoprenylcysteine carboxylmethyltransferase family protein [Granulosicoccus sp.]|nr:isoprenylcysteine carboxylmethyltransferase family protein [Granulosicoccus sp.]
MPDLVVVIIYLTFVLDFIVFPIPSEASTLAMSKHRNHQKSQKPYLVWATHLLVLITWFFPLLVALYHLLAKENPVSIALFTGGILFAILGRVITISTSLTLTRSRSSRKEPALVTTGLFSLSRHPIVLGLHMTLAGLLMTTGVAWTLIPFLITVLYFDYKLDIEESQLMELYGDNYAEYKNRTHRYLNWPNFY